MRTAAAAKAKKVCSSGTCAAGVNWEWHCSRSRHGWQSSHLLLAACVFAGLTGASSMLSHAGGGICRWLKDEEEVPLRPGATGLWVNVFGEAQTRFGQVLLSIERLQREMPGGERGGSPTPGERGEGGSGLQRGNALKVSSCQAYDYLLLAALRAQVRRGGQGAATLTDGRVINQPLAFLLVLAWHALQAQKWVPHTPSSPATLRRHPKHAGVR